MKIKICGITSIGDALASQEAGADFIGIIFEQKSPRFVELEKAKKIISSLPENTKFVGVFVNQSAEFIRRAAIECGLYAVQLHGGQNDEFVESLGEIQSKIWRAVWLESEDDLAAAMNMRADALLVDCRSGSSVGGTGRICDWNLAGQLARVRKIILAGGLGVENVRKAIDAVSPYAVDANSALEDYPAKKNILKIKNFINKVNEK